MNNHYSPDFVSLSRKKRIFKALNIFSMSVLVLNMSFGFALGGVFFVVEPASACHGNIHIVKVTDPANADEDFAFTGLGGFTLNPSINDTKDAYAVGNTWYTITESEKEGWTLTDIQCNEDKVTVDVENRKVNFYLKDKDDIRCTFYNKENDNGKDYCEDYYEENYGLSGYYTVAKWEYDEKSGIWGEDDSKHNPDYSTNVEGDNDLATWTSVPDVLSLISKEGTAYFENQGGATGTVAKHDQNALSNISFCQGPYCGDGNVDPGEECDDGPTGSDTCTTECTIKTQECKLVLEKEASADFVELGDPLTYRLTLKNIGGADCTGSGVKLREFYSDLTTYKSATSSPDSGDDYWNWNVMHPGDEKIIDILTQVTTSQDECGSTIMNEACAWAQELGDDIREKWVCDQVATTIKCPPKPECGDGIVGNTPGEECDDGALNGTSDSSCTANCKINPTIIKAYKVVCSEEKYLPNWGLKDNSNKPSAITPDSIDDFVQNSPNCDYQENWSFQWGYDFSDSDKVNKLPGNHTGVADGSAGPGTDTCEGLICDSDEWRTFTQKTKSSDSPAIETIKDVSIDMDDDVRKLWVREVLKPDENGVSYVPFVNPPGGLQDDSYTAELYCGGDIKNFDNYDYINDPKYGETYYCVAFNAVKKCGDGWINQDWEKCDDGNNIDGDGCSRQCTLEKGDISGHKYNEIISRNGTLDSGEPGVPNWLIYLDNGNGVLDKNSSGYPTEPYFSLTNDESMGNVGYYIFNQLPFGDYTVCEEMQDDWGTVMTSLCQDVTLDSKDGLVVDFFNYEKNYCGDGEKQSPNDNGELEQCDDGALNGTDQSSCLSDCTVKTPGKGSLKICKWADADGDMNTDDSSDRWAVENWEFTVSSTNLADDLADMTQKNGDEACVVFTGLEEGTYSITEENRIGWIHIDPATGNGSVTVEANKETRVDFYNQPLGDITICKYYDNGTIGQYEMGLDTPLHWGFDISYTYDHSATTTSQADTNEIDGCVTLSNVPFGDYHITEMPIVGGYWVNSYPADGFYDVNLNIENRDETVIFLNYQNNFCGDYIVQQPNMQGFMEECDDGPQGSETCTPTCEIPSEEPYCGDGHVDPGEECDDGNTDNNDGCRNNCTTPGGGGPYCGDGVLAQAYEECDDGNNIDGDGCNADCTIPGGSEPFCGDGILAQLYEECDDGNNIDGDGCNADCTIPGGGGPVCGNGVVEAGEECDDGNDINDDECSNDCTTITVYGEEGEPILVLNKLVVDEKAFYNPGAKQIVYEINIANNGNLTAFDVVLSDTLPEGLEYDDVESASRQWDIGDMEPGDIEQRTYLVNVLDETKAGTYVNTAEVTATNHDPLSDDADIVVKEIVVLAETGFDAFELFTLMFVLTALAGSSTVLRRKMA